MAITTCAYAQSSKHQNHWHYEQQVSATIKALDSLLSCKQCEYPLDALERFADECCRRFKGDNRIALAAAEAFDLKAQFPQTAYKRLRQLKQQQPREIRTYLLFAQLLCTRGDTALARLQIDSAKAVLPQRTEPYLKWAELRARFDEQETDSVISDLQQHFPNDTATLKGARIYYVAANRKPALFHKAIDYYSQTDSALLTPTDRIDYALACYAVKDYDRCIDIAQQGIQADSANYVYHRLVFWALTQQKQYEDACTAARQFFRLSDGHERYEDYQLAGRAFLACQHYDEALAVYQHVAAMPDDGFGDYEPQASRLLALRNIAGIYRESDRRAEALKAYNRLFDYRRQLGRAIEPTERNQQARIYYTWSTELTGQQRIEALYSADSLWAIMAAESPDNALYAQTIRLECAQQICRDTANVIDIKRPEIREAAIRVRDTALAQDTLDESDRQRLYEAYRILMWHYYYRWDEEGRGINDRRAAIANATALLDLGINDSSNDRAEAILRSFKVKR